MVKEIDAVGTIRLEIKNAELKKQLQELTEYIQALSANWEYWRKACLRAEHELRQVGSPAGTPDEYQKERMTCATCREQETCSYAWDLYNTNGDCLASK